MSSSWAPLAPKAKPSLWPDPVHDSRPDPEKAGGFGPDGFEAGVELMIVVEQVQLDVRSDSRPAAHAFRVDRRIAEPLKDLNGQIDTRIERVVSGGVLIQAKVNRHQPAESIVKHVQAVGALPFIDATITEVAQPIAVEVERRRQQYETFDALGVTYSGVDGNKATEARANQRDRPWWQASSSHPAPAGACA